MKDFEKFENEYDETMDYIMDVVAENSNPSRVKEFLSTYVNAYVLDDDRFEYMTKEEKDGLAEEVCNQFRLDDIYILIDQMVEWLYYNNDKEHDLEYHVNELVNQIKEDGLFPDFMVYDDDQEMVLNKVREEAKGFFGTQQGEN